jgi:DNA polymerase-3 subunit epsilon
MARYAVIDTETTGFGKSDRILEIAIVLVEDKEIVQEWETLINPERDISNSEIHGVTASQVSLAPVFADLVADITSLINDKILVAHNIAFDKRFLEMEFERAKTKAEFGSGFCTLQATGTKLDIACKKFGILNDSAHRALSDARATAQLMINLLESGTSNVNLSPIKIEDVKRQTTSRVLSRAAISNSFQPGEQNLRRIFRGIEISSERAGKELSYLDGIATVMSDFDITTDERAHLDDWAKTLGLSQTQQNQLHQEFFDGVVEVAKKDGYVSEVEELLITKAAKALKLRQDPINTEVEKFPLNGGMRICFTGKAKDQDGVEIDRTILEKWAKEAGFLPVSSVTKKDCDLVVAEDKSSSSGKAKKARDYGIPVFSVLEFLEAIEKK